MFVDDLFDKKSLTESQGGGSPWHSEPEQQQMDADRRGRLGRERNAGLDEPDDAVSGSAQTGNGVYEYTVPAGQEGLAQELGLQQHRGHWVSRVPIQRANFQFGQPQFHKIPSQGVAEGDAPIDHDWYRKQQERQTRAKQKQQGVGEGMLDNPGQEDSPVAQAIIRRILMQRTDLLAKHGPEKVGAAVDEVADFVGDVDEIGSSDVSGWVRQVERTLGNMQEGIAEAHVRNDAMITESKTYKLWESVGQKLVEYQLTADQVNQIFQQVEQGATAAGDNRTMIGKGKDAAAAVGTAWTDLKDKIYNSKPMSNFASAYDKAAEKLKQATGGDAGAMKYVQKYRDFATKNPMLQSAIYAALIAASGISGVGIGGAAALGLFKLVDQALQGKDIRSAAWSGAKTGAMAYAAGQIGQAMKGQTAGAEVPADMQQGLASDQAFQDSLLNKFPPDQGFTVAADGKGLQVLDAAGNKVWQGDIPLKGMDTQTFADLTNAGKMVNPATAGSDATAGAVQNTLNSERIANSELLAKNRMMHDFASKMGLPPGPYQATFQGGVPVTINGKAVPLDLFTADQQRNIEAARAIQQAMSGSKSPAEMAAAMAAAPNRNFESRSLSESQIYLVIGKIVERQRKLDEGIMDTIKGAAGKAVDWAKTKGTNLTTKITADKLLQAWKKAGSPTDSLDVAKVIQTAGVPSATIKQVYNNMKIPFAGEPGAQPAMTRKIDVDSKPTAPASAAAAPAAAAAPTTTPTATAAAPAPTPAAPPKLGVQTGATALIDPDTGKPYEKDKLAAMYGYKEPAAKPEETPPAPAAEPEKTSPAPVAQTSTPEPAAQTPAQIRAAKQKAAAATAQGQMASNAPAAAAQTPAATTAATTVAPTTNPAGFNAGNVMKLPGMEKYAKPAPAPKTANFGAGPTGYAKTTTSIKPPAAPSSPALAAPKAPSAPGSQKLTPAEYIKKIGAPALPESVAETLKQIDRMLESVNSKRSAEIVKAYADQQFTKLGLRNTNECKQIMAHVVHESAVRRRAYDQRMAK